MKPVTFERVDRIISLLHKTPNNSVQRAALWVRLYRLRSSLLEQHEKENGGQN